MSDAQDGGKPVETDAAPPVGSGCPAGEAGEAAGDLMLDTESYIDTYQIIAEWIRFADAKAAAVLTVSGALAGLVIPTFHGFLNRQTHVTEWWPQLGMGLFVAWLVLLLVSSVLAFRCILPYTRRGSHPSLDHCKHFHPAAIATSYKIDETQRFVRETEQLGQTGFTHEVMAGLLLDSHISSVKYRNVTRSIKLLAVSALFGFAYLIVSQF